jgi:hypothetical protein
VPYVHLARGVGSDLVIWDLPKKSSSKKEFTLLLALGNESFPVCVGGGMEGSMLRLVPRGTLHHSGPGGPCGTLTMEPACHLQKVVQSTCPGSAFGSFALTERLSAGTGCEVWRDQVCQDAYPVCVWTHASFLLQRRCIVTFTLEQSSLAARFSCVWNQAQFKGSVEITKLLSLTSRYPDLRDVK